MLKISEKANRNYLAKVVKLSGVRKHTNADKLQCVTVDGCNVVTGMDAKDGALYIYFPVESALNKEYLSWSNSFENKEMNADQEKKGFFNRHGRVRAIRLRQERSEGYIVPVEDLSAWLSEKTGSKVSIGESNVETEFDYFEDIQVCEKYVNREVLRQQALAGKKEKKAVRQSKLVDGQFRLHIDTSHLSKNMHKISPNDVISITNKLHGTSFVVGNVLCKKPLKWYEKVLQKVGVNVVDTHYDLVYSSRKVVKNQYNDNTNKQHFYGYDLWEEIAKFLSPNLTEGLTFYGEAVGFTKDGAFIQKGYDYGCNPGEFKVFIYRITLTNYSGKVFEFSAKQVKDFCSKFGLNHVPEYYYGYAKDLFPEVSVTEHWNENFLAKLTETYLEKDCEICVNKVPGEGVVVRREDLEVDVYKHKSFRFKQYESEQLDLGEVDIETQESEQVEE
jgi:hypothetical protein